MKSTQPTEGFIRQVYLNQNAVGNRDEYPFSLPSVQELEKVHFHPKVTFFVGENGTGKSTLIEAIAIAAGFNPEGGSKNFHFNTRSSESPLHEALMLVRNPYREKHGFFLRAESFYNVASNIEELDRAGGYGRPIIESYGGKSLHNQSHGESFMALAIHRFGPGGLFILDEPEAALSPQRQLALLYRMHELSNQGCQFIIASHSPIILGFPDATIWETTQSGLRERKYEELSHVIFTRDFLNHREKCTEDIMQQL